MKLRMGNTAAVASLCVAVLFLATLQACVSSDASDPARTDAAPVRVKALLIGTLDGELADDVAAQFDFGATTAGAGLPLIVGEAQWDARLADEIGKAAAARRPIAIVNATVDEINRLRQLLGLDEPFVLPQGYAYADAYGIDWDVEGDSFEIVVLPNVAPLATIEQTYTLDPAAGQATLSDTRSSILAPDDPDAAQQTRAASLAAWIADDEVRDRANTIAGQDAARSRAMVALDFGSIYDLDKIAKSTETRYVWSLHKNSYQVINNVWSAYDQVREDYVFYAQQRGIFAAEPEYWVDFYHRRGNFASRYTLTNTVPKLVWDKDHKNVVRVERYDNDSVQLGPTAPRTHEGKLSVDDGIDYKFDGKVGLDTKTVFDPSLGFGVQIKHGVKYEIPDTTVRNVSGNQISDAAWDFRIRWPNYIWNPMCQFFAFGETPSLGRATFQPSTEWIWRIKRSVMDENPKGLPIRTAFYAEIAERLIVPGTLCISIDTTWGTTGLYGDMTVPWPPTSVTKTK